MAKIFYEIRIKNTNYENLLINNKNLHTFNQKLNIQKTMQIKDRLYEFN